MIEELIKVLKDSLYNKTLLTEKELREVIEIYLDYYNIKLNNLYFENTRNGITASYNFNRNNIHFNFYELNKTGSFNYITDRFIFRINNKINYINCYYLECLFHELTHALDFNSNIYFNKLLCDACNEYITIDNGRLYKKNHDLVLLERDANIESNYLVTTIVKEILNDNITNYNMYKCLMFLLKDYNNDSPLDKFNKGFKNINYDFLILHDLLYKMYPNLDFNHLKYGLNISNEEYIYLVSLLKKILFHKIDTNNDIKELIKL